MFPEFSNGTSALTIELVKEIYEAGSIIKSWSYRTLANTGPKPQVVLINQKLFMNMVPSRLVSYFLVKPFVWFTNFLWRLAPHRIIDETLGDIRASYKKLQEAALQDLKPLQLWALVTSELARDFLTAGIIVDILAKGQDLTMDPVLAAAGKGSIAKLAIDFPYRSLSEWSLETPRFGEDDLDLMLGAFVKRDQFFPMPKTPADQALTLLALARDNLSFAVAILRLALLREFGGHTGIFNRSFLELETGFDFKHPQPLELIQPKPGAPSRLNLIQLEQWISGDAVDQAKSAGFWVSCKSRVIGVVDGDGSNAGHIIKVVEHPTVQDVISLPKNAVLVALSGNRLSHAAQVLRDRKIPGLFGAAKFADKLQPGNTVVIDEDGVIENAS
jgi:phosphohistidine swiveling domain-containing protein